MPDWAGFKFFFSPETADLQERSHSKMVPKKKKKSERDSSVSIHNLGDKMPKENDKSCTDRKAPFVMEYS